MFLDIVEKRNPTLLKAAMELHKNGEILPDTYVLDLDAIFKNGEMLLEEAGKYGIKLYAMTKQFGRIPFIGKKLVDMGFQGVVTVDFKEAEIMIKNGVKLGNVGHLVQIPSSMVERVVENNPEIITIYSIEKAEEINRAAEKQRKIQPVMVRVMEKDSKIYSGQWGGFYIEELGNIVPQLLKMKNIKLEGVTSFPCFLYDSEKNSIEKTPNISGIHRAKEIIESFGVEISQLNMPSATSLENMKKIAENRGTHGEPGHALTGTTPFNSLNPWGEIPAMVYVSEISHNLSGKSYVYGGGHYRRSGMENILVGKVFENLEKGKIEPPTMESIDYYFQVDGEREVGSTVLAAFRTQIFVTRSDVALVSGIASGSPKLVGIYDSQGREKI